MELRQHQGSIRRLMPLTPHPHRVQEIRGKMPTRAGISSLAPIDFNGSQLRFVSGGHDHWVHLWTISERRNTFLSQTAKINVLHNSPVAAMAYRKHNRTLVSAAGNQIRVINLDRSITLTNEAVSEHVYHLHVHPNDSNVSILEVISHHHVYYW
jgi:WD40 repeat protein